MQRSHGQSRSWILGCAALAFVACAPAPDKTLAAPADAQAEVDRPDFLPDGRAALYLTADQHAHISGQMLNFLRGVRTLNKAVLEEDRETIAAKAGELGPPRGANGPEHRAMMQGIPDEFHQLGMPLRHQFEAISQMAADAPMRDIQAQLADAMNKCVDCHSTYGSVRLAD